MGQIATTIPPKGLGNIQLSDFWKGLLLAAFTNILLSLYTIVDNGGWPSHNDWMVILRTTLAIVIAYLLKNLGTNNVGQLFQKDKKVVHVDADELRVLEDKAENVDQVQSKKK